MIISAGSVIGPAEVGLLATIGMTSVPCYRRPVVGIMSTGNELIDLCGSPPSETKSGSLIYDSNRPSLIAAFRLDCGKDYCIDLGIVPDTVEGLRTAVLEAVERCDVLVTSGGVSMGQADFVKTVLQDIGTVFSFYL